jgi:hypothetical protein
MKKIPSLNYNITIVITGKIKITDDIFFNYIFCLLFHQSLYFL